MDFKRVYFIGIGGIGMSALARYFMHQGKPVAGYDKTPSELTAELQSEGAEITYLDQTQTIPAPYRSPADTLVVYTPAIPADSSQLGFFQNGGFEVVKRSQMLGVVTRGKYVMAVAGTHGKTSTTTMAAWFNYVAGSGCGQRSRLKVEDRELVFDGSPKQLRGGLGSAFLGGISKNFGSNMVLGEGRRIAVEADEFDRSFLQLSPDAAVITSVDADHLDIYGTHSHMKEAFTQFVDKIEPGGVLVIKEGAELEISNKTIKVYSYGCDSPVGAQSEKYRSKADFRAVNITLADGGKYNFDLVFPDRVLENCTLGIPGIINVENCVAAAALVWCAGFDQSRLKVAMASFRGVKRRFDFWINTPQRVYMDDYAHHPQELSAAIGSLRGMFPGKKLTVVFQPHLFSRTRDFFKEFASVLSLADDLILMPIYPAREEPIEGVTSEMMLPLIRTKAEVVDKDLLLDAVTRRNPELLVTFGAGDIDRFCAPLAKLPFWQSDLTKNKDI